MELRVLKCFLAVAREENITKAAAALYPPLSLAGIQHSALAWNRSPIGDGTAGAHQNMPGAYF